jgi:hypothetical protein
MCSRSRSRSRSINNIILNNVNNILNKVVGPKKTKKRNYSVPTVFKRLTPSQQHELVLETMNNRPAEVKRFEKRMTASHKRLKSYKPKSNKPTLKNAKVRMLLSSAKNSNLKKRLLKIHKFNAKIKN